MNKSAPLSINIKPKNRIPTTPTIIKITPLDMNINAKSNIKTNPMKKLFNKKKLLKSSEIGIEPYNLLPSELIICVDIIESPMVAL